MLEQGFAFFITITLMMLAFVVASIIIPFYGFIKKSWKGLAIGCLIQPIFCALVCFIVIISVYLFQRYDLRKSRNEAMVTIKKVDADGYIHYWHLKDDVECFYELKEKNNADHEYNGYDNGKLFDVLPNDSTSVIVDDKIVVRFDIENKKVTATEYGEPMDVEDVNWDKVKKYYAKQP